MADVHIYAEEYQGHDLTIQVRVNAGDPADDNGTENTHNIWSAVDDLSTLSFTAGATGDTITDAGLAGKYVSAIDIDGGDKIYARRFADGSFTFNKSIAGTTIQLGALEDGTAITVTSGDAINVYYLPDGTGTEEPDLTYAQLVTRLPQVLQDLKNVVDTPTNPDINSLAWGLGFARNT